MTLCLCRNGSNVLHALVQASVHLFNAVEVVGIILETRHQPVHVVMVPANVRFVLAGVVSMSRSIGR